MAGLVLDTGALIAIDRGDREVLVRLNEAARGDREPVTSSACVAEAWRDPARQARLARAMKSIVERPLDAESARECGLLLARSDTSQVADAAIALCAGDEDIVLTSDPDEIEQLLDAIPTAARVRAV